MIPWTFVTVLCILLFSGTAHPRVDQPDKVITVALGNTVTLQCYSDKDNIFWYKQIAGQQPRVISALQKMSEPIFYNEFKNDRFCGKRLGRTSNLTISGIIQSDEAVYYCGAKAFYIEFGSGTHLIIKGQQDSTSKISKSDHLSDFTKCHQKCFENSTNQVKNEERLCPAVLGLACALGLCGVLIFALVGFIFKRVHVSGQDNQVRGAQDTDDENLTYAALRFSQRKIKSGGRREKSQQSVILYDSL
ncbi:novel immune-type receptor 14b [Onychostoma macrolepis]|uniref:novel immune-type receptor 14b n=1 Tax=Onychostoma macrolepis TaxID=369639 RepID=UPI00272A067F|nr:novel immune-type receptor 14b [Onychostoma macrolepis]